MENARLITLPPGHPHADAIERANIEIQGGVDAAAGGNLGRARVCARRAVGAYLQAIGSSLPGEVGANAMANLRYLQEAEHLPPDQRQAAERLAGGARSQMAGGAISEDPLADAAVIINYFVRQASGTSDQGIAGVR
jgi:hypothetical protein